ncbi:ribosomal protein S18 acetylase RimI-like enzyme [Pedobacter sp. UYP30]|uniref:GNAT family N-acetyltransferase n=1 Tax=Pedobacter sp. UYP30 TaxID=1756400 RepID=UPI003391085C
MIHIRKATQKDVGLIFNLAKDIWPSAYLEIIGQAQVDYMLDKMYNATELSKQMAEGHIFLIAEQHHQALGFAGFSLVDAEAHTYKLHKLYVLPETQGTGLGWKLVDEVLKFVRAVKGKTLLLNVNKFNKARFFYEKLGFEIIEDVKIDIGGGFFMDDFVMEKKVEGVKVSESKE